MKTKLKTVAFFLLFYSFITSSILAHISTTAEDTIVIATFNIRIFSDNSRDDQELYRICTLLRHFDLVAIQEVRDTTVLDRTTNLLESEFGLDYQYIASSRVGRGVKEIYAFLFRANRVRYLGAASFYSEEEDVFIREPFYGKFVAGSFDFYVITIHSIYGDRVSERRAEALVLDEVYTFVQDLDDENDILLMGDFNLPPYDKGFSELLSMSEMTFVNSDIPTSIADRLYDNIFFQSGHTQEYTGHFGVVKFDEEFYDNDDRNAGLEISDHRPLWAEFDVGQDDD